MSKISAVIITKNEEANIEKCISSCLPAVDEVIVIDAHSSDNTKRIAEGLGAKVFVQDWVNYSYNKNLGNERASHNFILSIDADEELSEALAQSIIGIKENLSGAYSMNRLNNYYGHFVKRGGFYPDKKVRLFDKRKVHWEGDSVHEWLNHSQVSVDHLSGDLHHYTYSDLADHLERQNRYAALAAEKLKSKSATTLFFKQWFSPPVRFVQSFLLKGGFLEGRLGFTLAKMHARDAWIKHKLARS